MVSEGDKRSIISQTPTRVFGRTGERLRNGFIYSVIVPQHNSHSKHDNTGDILIVKEQFIISDTLDNFTEWSNSYHGARQDPRELARLDLLSINTLSPVPGTDSFLLRYPVLFQSEMYPWKSAMTIEVSIETGEEATLNIVARLIPGFLYQEGKTTLRPIPESVQQYFQEYCEAVRQKYPQLEQHNNQSSQRLAHQRLSESGKNERDDIEVRLSITLAHYRLNRTFPRLNKVIALKLAGTTTPTYNSGQHRLLSDEEVHKLLNVETMREAWFAQIKRLNSGSDTVEFNEVKVD
jgi:hypothetical protein